MPSRITDVTITPVAFADPPLLNNVGVHEPFALRSVIEITTEDRITGLGESYGDDAHLAKLRQAAQALQGVDVFDLHAIERATDTQRVLAAFEVAALDAQGRLLGRPVSDLLGGAVRDEVAYSAYAFYKWAAHPGQAEDDWGAALDPAGVVAQVRRMIDEYGFTAIKLKGGVFPPAQEVEAIKALRAEFPDVPLRLDPNGAWTPETSVWVAQQLDGVLEYLEDPTPGIPGMASVAAKIDLPLATNMCVVEFDHLPPAVAQDAVQVVLSDHHFWGGLKRSQDLARICEVFGMGLSMHSNSHLGISLAAMTHLAAATPNLDYACDTHWPWKTEDVVTQKPVFTDGAVKVSTAPGLGVDLDRDALAALHEQWQECGTRKRDDTTYMRTVDPGFSPHVACW